MIEVSYTFKILGRFHITNNIPTRDRGTWWSYSIGHHFRSWWLISSNFLGLIWIRSLETCGDNRSPDPQGLRVQNEIGILTLTNIPRETTQKRQQQRRNNCTYLVICIILNIYLYLYLLSLKFRKIQWQHGMPLRSILHSVSCISIVLNVSKLESRIALKYSTGKVLRGVSFPRCVCPGWNFLAFRWQSGCW